MAYQQKTWQSGEVITSAALNNIETGIGELIDHNTKMANSFTSDQLKIGSDNTLIEGKDGKLTVADTITTKNLEIMTAGTATFPAGSTVTISGTITVPDLNEQKTTSNAASTNYVNGKFALQSTTITAGNGLTSSGTLGASPSISLNAATSSVFGGITVGKGLKINDDNKKLDVNVNDIDSANKDGPGLMSKDNFNKLAGLNIKIGNTTISTDQNHAFDLSSQITNNINVYGTGSFIPNSGTVNLKGVVTGVTINDVAINAPIGDAATSGLIDIGRVVRSIKVSNDSTLSPSTDNDTEGVVDISSAIPDISGKANSANPVFTGTITLGSVTLNETQLSNLLNLLNDGGEGT